MSIINNSNDLLFFYAFLFHFNFTISNKTAYYMKEVFIDFSITIMSNNNYERSLFSCNK